MSETNIPDELKYTKEHEWVSKIDDKTLRIGITDHAQNSLSDVVYVELPEKDATFSQGDSFGVVDSVKASSELYLPTSGTIRSINNDIQGSPERVNQDPYGDGWMIELSPFDENEYNALMDADQYREYLEGLDQE